MPLILQPGISACGPDSEVVHERLFLLMLCVVTSIHSACLLLPYDLQVAYSLCQEVLSSNSCSMLRELRSDIEFIIYYLCTIL